MADGKFGPGLESAARECMNAVIASLEQQAKGGDFVMASEVVFDLAEQRRIALAAEVDVRTLQRVLRGEPIRPASRHRIRRALAARGLAELVPLPGKEG